MHTLHTPCARHVQHVPLTKELFGALFTQHCPAVDLGRYLKADTCREVGLDGTGDHVDGWTLRRHDHMQAGGTRHLCEALDGDLDIFSCNHHQVGHFIDDDDDHGQGLRIKRPFFEHGFA